MSPREPISHPYCIDPEPTGWHWCWTGRDVVQRLGLVSPTWNFQPAIGHHRADVLYAIAPGDVLHAVGDDDT